MSSLATLADLVISSPVPTKDGYDGLVAGLAGKVDAETGKGLSANDFTDTYKAMLDGERSNAFVRSVTVNGVGSSPVDVNGNVTLAVSAGDVFLDDGETTVQVAVAGKVDRDGSKQLSDENFTRELKEKLEGLSSGGGGDSSFETWKSAEDVACGSGATAQTTGSESGVVTGCLAAGHGASASGVAATAVGPGSLATAYGAVAVGPASAGARCAFAATPGASATAENAVAHGAGATASHKDSVSLGAGAKSQGDGTLNLSASDMSHVYLGAAGDSPKTLADLVSAACDSRGVPEDIVVNSITAVREAAGVTVSAGGATIVLTEATLVTLAEMIADYEDAAARLEDMT